MPGYLAEPIANAQGVSIVPSGNITASNVQSAINELDTEKAPSTGIAQSSVTNLVSDLSLKANLASPALTGTPTAPTPSASVNNTQVATTAFVRTANSGNVIQTVVTDLTTTYTRGSAAAIADVTGFAASITPKFSNSNVLILIQGAIYAICDGYWYIKRNGTQVGTLGNSPRIDFAHDDPAWFYSYLDSPATTSQVTYQMSANATGCGQTIYVNSQGGSSRMILMEIQA